MAFCTRCGSPVEGDFCSKCGTKIDSSSAGLSQNPADTPSGAPVVIPPTPGKKGKTLLWVLGGCLLLVVIVGIVIFSTGLFIARRAGIDSETMAKNPGVAVAKLMIGANPDLEIVSIDEGHGIVRVRDKKSGKTMTMNLEDAQKGKIVFTDDKDQRVEFKMQGEGDNAEMEIKSSEGSMRVGAGSVQKLPDWFPPYPNAPASGYTGFSKDDGKSGSFSFKSSDPAETVAAFYENALKKAGFRIEKTTSRIPGQGSIIMISAVDDSGRRTANITVARAGDSTTTNLAYEVE